MLDISIYSDRLRKLCDEYYYGNIGYAEYKQQRDEIFDCLDEGLESGVIKSVKHNQTGFNDVDQIGTMVDMCDE